MKNIYCILLLLVTSLSYSQIKLEGIVKDSLNIPLELANVVAFNQETKALESYGITNEQGEFSLELGMNGEYNIQDDRMRSAW